jgi:RNA recognition motif-containing protein
MTSIFVAKLDFNTTDEQLKSLFEEHGRVNRVTIAKDRETGKPRGFAFVEMADESEADAAIEALDNSTVNGRTIAVKKADDRGSKPAGDRPQRTDNRPPRGDRPFTPRDDNRSTDYKSDYKKSDDTPSRPMYNPDDLASQKVERKKEKEVPAKKAIAKPDVPKKPKMEAYKKSGKSNRFFDDDDDDFEWELQNRKNASGWDDDEEE